MGLAAEGLEVMGIRPHDAVDDVSTAWRPKSKGYRTHLRGPEHS